MGEVFPAPPESDIRAEALFIIDAAKRRREEERVRYLRENPGGEREGLTPPPTSRLAPASTNGLVDDTNGPAGIVQAKAPSSATATNGARVPYHTPQSTISVIPPPNGFIQQSSTSSWINAQSTPDYPIAGPSSLSLASSSATAPAIPPHPQPSQIMNGRPAPAGTPTPTEAVPAYPPGSFEAQLEAISEGYKAGVNATPHSIATMARLNANALVAPQDIALGRGPNDMVPPRFHSGQKPVVMLANPGTRHRAKDRLAREHQEGFEGLSDDVEVDSEGFVDNVMVSRNFKPIRAILT